MRHWTILAIATALPASALAQTPRQTEVSRTRPPEPTGAEISVRDAMTRTYIIADDSMEGRDTGRRGGVRSANYIANELKRLGIERHDDLVGQREHFGHEGNFARGAIHQDIIVCFGHSAQFIMKHASRGEAINGARMKQGNAHGGRHEVPALARGDDFWRALKRAHGIGETDAL